MAVAGNHLTKLYSVNLLVVVHSMFVYHKADRLRENEDEDGVLLK